MRNLGQSAIVFNKITNSEDERGRDGAARAPSIGETQDPHHQTHVWPNLFSRLPRSQRCVSAQRRMQRGDRHGALKKHTNVVITVIHFLGHRDLIIVNISQ